MSETARSARRTVAAAGCAVVLASMLGACGNSLSTVTPAASTIPTIPTVHGSVPLPTLSTTSTGTAGDTSSAPVATTISSTAGTASSKPASQPPSTHSAPGTPGNPVTTAAGGEFLWQSDLPDYPAYGWTAPQFNQLGVEHPLPDTCDTSLGPQPTRGVREADYGSRSGDVTAVEDVYTYASAADASAQLAPSLPKCGGLSVQTGMSFAWEGAGPGPTGLQHVLFLVQGNRIATLVVTPGPRDYSTALDAGLLTEMAARLRNS